MRRSFCVIPLIVAACYTVVIGQDDGEQRIRKSLEGRVVLVKMDLPAIDAGVDLILNDTEVSYDAANYDKLVKNYGVSIKKGSRARITSVRVSPRGLEIDLDGGGLPGPDWMVGNLKLKEPSPAAKSDHEIEIERQSQSETNPAMINYLHGEIDYERQRRLEQDERNRDAYNRFDRLRKQYVEQNRKSWGSKVVIVVRSTKESITMRDMVKSLAKYVELLPSEKPSK